MLRVAALRHGQCRHLLAVLVVPLEPAGIGDRHALPRAAKAVGRGELRGALRISAGQVLVGAARVVHRPPHHRVFAHPGEQRVDRLLHGAADICRADLDVPAEIGQFQHRHHAVDRHDRDAVDLGMSGRRQFRIGRQTVDVGQSAAPNSATASFTAVSACAASGISAERVTLEKPTPLTATLHRFSHMQASSPQHWIGGGASFETAASRLPQDEVSPKCQSREVPHPEERRRERLEGRTIFVQSLSLDGRPRAAPGETAAR